MKKILTGLVLLAVCAPAFADAVDQVLTATIGRLSHIEGQTPGEEVLSLVCDKGADGRVTLYYRRHCPAGSTLDELEFFYTAGSDAFPIDNVDCDGSVDTRQFLIIWGANKDREVAELGRAFNALCRELPFDGAATCN